MSTDRREYLKRTGSEIGKKTAFAVNSSVQQNGLTAQTGHVTLAAFR
jgi:hypothetical protein